MRPNRIKIQCVMCGGEAIMFVTETGEPVCDRCRYVNEEARLKSPKQK